MRPPGFFRSDIEGLRAIAIVAVVLYHADVPGFASGYIGVDAFFVISGFLITGILVREGDRHRKIDLLRFWGRRAARLLPNAILTLGVTMVAIMTLAPVLTRAAGAGDVAATLLYYANFHFSARTLDYFDQGVQASPVLHFWSLSVEEQFYLFWPLFISVGLLAFKRLNRAATLVFLTLLAAGSFGAMVYLARAAPSRAFFDTEARVWQLAVGAMLAVWLPAGQVPRRYAATIGWAGLVGLLLSVGLLDRLPVNPRMASVIPTLAAAAALYGGAGSREFATNAVLGNPAMQWIGRRSYSLYLWHWPLLVFAAPLLGRGFTIALLVPIASLAFAWVEQPLRLAAPARLSPGKLLGLAVGACFGAAALALVLPSLDPAYASARGDMLRRLTVAKDDGPRQLGPACKTQADADTGLCVFGKPGGAKRVVLYGDSHAEQLFDGLNAAAKAAGWELRVWVRGGCTPIDFATNDEVCTQFHHNVFEALPLFKPDLIVVAAANGGAIHLHERLTGKAMERQQSLAIWKAGFRRSLEILSGTGARVVVVRDTPLYSKPMGTECLETRAPAECVTPRSEALAADAPDVLVTRTMPGIELVDLSDRFCDAKSCPAFKDGQIVFRADNNHITATVSLWLEADFLKVLGAAR